jgi:Undecaprenyl-phosphate galactose phosphotransferase WbaP
MVDGITTNISGINTDIQEQIVSRPARNLWITFASFMLSDLLALSIAGVASVLLRSAFHGRYDPSDYLLFAPALALFVTAFGLMGLYPGIALNPVEEMRRALYAISTGYLVILAITFMFREAQTYSRGIFAMVWPLSVVSVILSRSVVRALLGRKSWWGVPAVILGAGETGQLVLKTLQKYPSSGLKPAAILDESQIQLKACSEGSSVIFAGGLHWAPVLAKRFGLTYAIVAMPELPSKKLSELLSRYTQNFQHLLIIPDMVGMTTLGVCTRDLGGLVGIEVSQKLIHRFPQVGKRALDLSISILFGVLLLPVLSLIAVLVWISSPGPVLYGQRRIGRGGHSFTAWKFRSMVKDADAVLRNYLERHPEFQQEWQRDQKLRRDPRITRIGRFLRKTSLDELPQLWDIVCGHMSLVGPRPIVETEIEKYGDAFDLYTRVRPGVTGLWQVSGRNNTSAWQRIEFDEYYVRNWSVWLDLYILGQTVKAVLLAEGAY